MKLWNSHSSDKPASSFSAAERGGLIEATSGDGDLIGYLTNFPPQNAAAFTLAGSEMRSVLVSSSRRKRAWST